MITVFIDGHRAPRERLLVATVGFANQHGFKLCQHEKLFMEGLSLNHISVPHFKLLSCLADTAVQHLNSDHTVGEQYWAIYDNCLVRANTQDEIAAEDNHETL